MAGKRDYYEVLGVDRSATDKQIADAYRRLALKYHPDRNAGDEETVVLFKEAAEAFEVLSDGERRARYDRYGHAAFQGASGGRGFADVNDIFAAFGDIFGESAFGDLFGGRRRGPRKGADVRCDVTLDLMQAAAWGHGDCRVSTARDVRRLRRLGSQAGYGPRGAATAAAAARWCKARASFACRRLAPPAMAAE